MVSSQMNPGATTTNQMAGVAAIAEPIVIQKQIEAKSEALSLADLITTRAIAEEVDPTLARKIAYCESTMRQFDKDGKALRGIHNPDDVGLFQINESYHLEKSLELGYDIHKTEGNIGYAMWLLKNEGQRHWKWSQPCWDK